MMTPNPSSKDATASRPLAPLILLWFAPAFALGAQIDDRSEALAAVRADEARRIAVCEQASRAVVCVFADSARSGGGSGVLIHPDGYGLTNFHVVADFLDSRRGVGGLSDGKLYPLRIIGVDPAGDIVLFKLDGRQRFEFAPLGDSDAARVGQWVLAAGNPFLIAEDLAPTVSLGVIGGVRRYQRGQGARGSLLEYADCIQVSASINPGSSGGPLFNMRGRVIGINGRASFEQRGRVNVGLGYAVTTRQIERFLPALRAGRLCEHGTLGATVRKIGDELIVGAIQTLSPAERAGLQLGDELLAVAGRRLHTPNDFLNILTTLPSEWPVLLRLRRDGREYRTAARLERLPLGAAVPFLVDLEHNHAQIRRLLRRYAENDLRKRAGRATEVNWRGRLKRTVADVEHAFDLIVRQKLDGALRIERVRDGGNEVFETTIGDSRPPTSSASPAWQDAELWYEWHRLTAPLLGDVELSVGWELQAGDEVGGRITHVLEHRTEASERFRWKFDVQSANLLAATVLANPDARDPICLPAVSEPILDAVAQRAGLLTAARLTDAALWIPAARRENAGLNWPHVWRRLTESGELIEIEIESFKVEFASNNAATSQPVRKGEP